MKKKTEMTVLDSRMLAQDIWSLELAYAPEDLPEQVRPGQFAGLYPPGGDLLLMRPISICRWDRERGVLRFVYRAAGKGTRSFTSLRPGDHMDMLGPPLSRRTARRQQEHRLRRTAGITSLHRKRERRPPASLL